MTVERPRPWRIFSASGMELCCLYAMLALVQARACSQCFFMPLVLVFFGIAFGIERLFSNAGGRRILLHILSWVIWCVLAMLFTVLITNAGSEILGRIFTKGSFPSPEFLSLCGSALSWGCGKRISRLSIDESVLLSEFQFGIFILLIVFFLDGQWALGTRGLVPLTMVFTVFALGGLPGSLIRPSSRGPKERRIGWFVVVALSISTVLAAGLLIAAILKPEFITLLLSIAETVGRFIGQMILKMIDFLVSLFPTPEPQSLKDLPDLSGKMKGPSIIAKMLTIPESVRKVANFLVAAIWIGLILAALWSLSKSLLNWLLRRGVNPDGTEVETLSGAFREDLFALMRWLLWKMDRLLTIFLGLCGIRRIRSIAGPDLSSARAVYRQLLRWSVRKGCARAMAQTPGEYLHALGKKYPGGCAEFSMITSAYIEERYGLFPASEGALHKAQESWSMLKRKKHRDLNRQDAM